MLFTSPPRNIFYNLAFRPSWFPPYALRLRFIQRDFPVDIVRNANLLTYALTYKEEGRTPKQKLTLSSHMNDVRSAADAACDFASFVWYSSIAQSRSMERVIAACLCHHSCCMPYVKSLASSGEQVVHKSATLFWTITSAFPDGFYNLVPVETGTNGLQFTCLVVLNRLMAP